VVYILLPSAKLRVLCGSKKRAQSVLAGTAVKTLNNDVLSKL